MIGASNSKVSPLWLGEQNHPPTSTLTIFRGSVYTRPRKLNESFAKFNWAEHSGDV